ncbi:hypothetical protein C8Q75DRAFT_140639 [Abortiporus biennis]|nr:hypothetical protein C8Q75DRAFT_140639 [Abortiporus biennis]
MSFLNLQFDNTLGAIFLGNLAVGVLTGIVSVQTYIYFMNSGKKDHPFLRAMIGFLWILDTFGFCCATVDAYNSLVTNFMNPLALPSIKWEVPAYLISAVFSNCMIKTIYIYRISKVDKNIYRKIILAAANIIDVAFGLAMAGRVVQIGNYFQLDSIKWLCITTFASHVFIDTMIAIILCLALRQKRTGFSRTDSQLDTLMRYAVHTGALTSVVAISILILYLTMPNNLIFVGVYMTLPKFYHNALLANLNARDKLKSTMGASVDYNSVHLSKVNMSSSTESTSEAVNDKPNTLRTIIIGNEDPTSSMERAVSMATFEAWLLYVQNI